MNPALRFAAARLHAQIKRSLDAAKRNQGFILLI
jgi:hypothetical protein